MTKKKKLISGVLAALVVMAAAAMVVSGKQGLPVETAAVKERAIIRTVLANGHFQAADGQEIVARDPVVIEDILVEAGDKVKEGQVLAVIDTAGLEAEKQAAQAELAAISTQLATLEATLPLQRAEAGSQMEAARENLQQAEREAAAMAGLYADGAVSEMDWRRAQSALAASHAQEQTARVQMAQIESKAVLLQQYQEQGQALDSRIQVIAEKLDFYQMRAPAAGQVVEVYVRAGAVVGAGTPLFLLAAPGLLVEAEVLAQDAPALAPGQKVLISGEVLRGGVLTGQVSRIHPRAVEKTSELGVVQRRVPIEIVPDQEEAKMCPGYPVEVEIITAETSGLAVPREAVFSLDGRDYVFTIKNGRAALTPVETGLEGEDYLEVLTGLKTGDTVIINPPKETADGIKTK